MKSRIPLIVPRTESNKSDGTDDIGIFEVEDFPGDAESLSFAAVSSSWSCPV
jgi:hypothetical protein